MNFRKLVDEINDTKSVTFNTLTKLEHEIGQLLKLKSHSKSTRAMCHYLRIIIKIKYRHFIESHLKKVGLGNSIKLEKYIEFQLKRISVIAKPLLLKNQKNRSYVVNEYTFCVLIELKSDKYYIYAHRNIWSSRIKPDVVLITRATDFERAIFKAQKNLSNQLPLV